jgi:hypothetical protein
MDAALVAELVATHGVHTIILYGSRARGDATAESDIDVATFADVARTLRDARVWNGMYLDVFVYPTSVATSPLEDELLKLETSRVLLDERGLAASLLDRVADRIRQGPPPLTDDDRQMRTMWARKTVERVRRGDLEAHYRAHQLLFQLLEDYFALRGRWYRGPKESFAAMRRDDPTVFALFERALAPGASVDAMAAVVAAVLA